MRGNRARTPANLAFLLVALALSLQSPGTAWAGGCGADVRLDSPGRPLAQIPREMQDSGNCFIYAATQMADAWRLSHPPAEPGPEHLTSALRLSQQMCVSSDGKNICDGGWPADALAALETNGSCNHYAMYGHQGARSFSAGRESFLEDDLRAAYKRMSQAMATDQGKAELLDILREQEQRSPASSTEVLQLQTVFVFAQRHQFGVQLCHDLAKEYDETIVGAGHAVGDVLSALMARGSAGEFVKAFFDRACSLDTTPVRLPKPHVLVDPGADTVMKTINAELDSSNPQPVAISYCPAVLDHARPYRGKNGLLARAFAWEYCQRATLSSDKAGTNVHQEHASLVIGRRTNPRNGECEFLVRNTWGSDCDPYSAGPAHWDCEDGQVWVSQSDLAANTFRLDYLSEH